MDSTSLNKATVYHDLNSLNNLRQEARRDEKQALRAAVKEFEAYFLNLMLKNMRSANQVIGEDSPLNSNDVQFYNEMHDQQLALELSQTSRFGIGDVLFKQLSSNLPNQSKPSLESKQLNFSSIRNPSLNSKSVTNLLANESLQVDQEPKSLNENDSNIGSLIDSGEQDAVSAAMTNLKVQRDVGAFSTQNNSSFLKVLPFSVDRIVKSVSASPAENKSTEAQIVKQPETIKFKSKQDFIEHLKPMAIKAAKLLGISPGILIAQAALETGWGKFFTKDASGNDSFNLFGIKANNGWKGKHVSSNTLEFEQGIPKKMRQNFRAYSSLEDSVQDYVSFIKENPRYQPALEHKDDAKSYIEQIQSSGYATDPDYAKKVHSIFQRESLNNIQN